MKKTTGSARSAETLDGVIWKYVDILQGVAQGCTLSPDLFKACIHNLILTDERSKAGSHGGAK